MIADLEGHTKAQIQRVVAAARVAFATFMLEKVQAMIDALESDFRYDFLEMKSPAILDKETLKRERFNERIKEIAGRLETNFGVERTVEEVSNSDEHQGLHHIL